MPTKIDAILSRMTIDEKLGQMILASIEVSQMNDATREFLCANHIGNVILFGKNCAGRENLARLNTEIQAAIQAATGLPALIAIDQEGGCVTRLRSEATARWSWPAPAMLTMPIELAGSWAMNCGRWASILTLRRCWTH